MRTVHPSDAGEAAHTLAEASRARQHVRIEGSGTKSDWTRHAPAVHVLLSTRRLNQVIAHRHGDLTATVEAGATLDDANRQLSRHGQWIPLDPSWSDRATIGGIVATNDAGPRRHRYGAPRDLIIGIEIARADGTRAKAGGIVVKNVAGYDLARLMTGSYGSLGLILNATFKLSPLPASSRTVIADLPTHAAAGALVSALNASQVAPTAIEVETNPLRLLVRFESTERSAQHQSEAVVRHAQRVGGRAEIAAGAFEQQAWEAHAARPWSGEGIVVKIAFLPARLAATLDSIASAAADCPWEVVGRAGVGVLLLRLQGGVGEAARVVAQLRRCHAPGEGSVTVLRGTKELDVVVDPSTAFGDAFSLMQAVKLAFDPEGVLPPLG